jgi:Flp pilus assembly CpaE family ATPase
VFRLLGRQYEFIVIDAGCQVNTCSTAAMYAADSICVVANPDVPSVRNAQRMLDRVQQLGLSSERVKVLLNRAAEPYPIPPSQIESALGHPIAQMFPSDYRTVSAALNSGVPLALSGNTDLAAQFDRFTRSILAPGAVAAPVATKRGLGLERLASLW